jgi:hypothetical protein
MSKPKVYADFQNLDDTNRLRLTCVGTLDDLARQKIELREGLVLTFYMDDADDHGRPDELLGDGVVHYDECARSWVASIDWARVRHASDDEARNKHDPAASRRAPASEDGLTGFSGSQPSPAADFGR